MNLQENILIQPDFYFTLFSLKSKTFEVHICVEETLINIIIFTIIIILIIVVIIINLFNVDNKNIHTNYVVKSIYF